MNIKYLNHHKKFLFIIIGLITGLLPQYSFSQGVVVSAFNKPLHLVLFELRDNYQVEFSFNHAEVSEYLITLNKTSKDIPTALTEILKATSLTFEQSGKVFLIYEKKIPEIVKSAYRLEGTIFDSISKESLPFAALKINNQQVLSTENGYFSFVSDLDSIFRIKVQYLGYLAFDTTIWIPCHVNFFLIPAMQLVDEVQINLKLIDYNTESGSKSNVIRINPQVANYLPGNGDNAIFNLLRLQPGILASGEYSSDLIIWGNYKSQSTLKFDGFRVFGNYNFNDNISAVNPFLVKDMQIIKAAYPAKYGNAVGGIVNITGNTGNNKNHDIKLNINNNTLTGLYSFPLAKNINLSLAARTTYFDLYEPQKISDIFYNSDRYSSIADAIIYPDYRFRDCNLRIAGKTNEKNNYYASFYSSNDVFDFRLNEEQKNYLLIKNQQTINKQKAGSLFFRQTDKNGNEHQFLITQSNLNRTKTDSIIFKRPKLNKTILDNYISLNTQLQEQSISYLNTTQFDKNSQWIWGAEFNTHTTNYEAEIKAQSFQTDSSQKANQFSLHFTHKFNIDSSLQIETGLRTSYVFSVQKDFWMPRISLSYQIKHFSFNLSGGIYSQILQENEIINALGNVYYQWMLADLENVPMLSSRHLVFGSKFEKNGFQILNEFFLKNTEGHSRYLMINNNELHAEGKSRAYGMDLYLKKNYRGSSAWISYTLSYTQEHFPYFQDDYWRRAFHDQRHEIKLAALLDLHPFYPGINYVWGSGFPDPSPLIIDSFDDNKYNRLDISLIYRISKPLWKMELGASILNLTNYKNIKYENFSRVPRNKLTSFVLYSEAVPFTPTVFLHLVF
jgi:hypothetical protein